MALQHLRASTADKRPTPAAMADGQLAMNTNLASPGLFFKDSNGDLVKIGPVHIGTTAPNATPASGGQAGNSKGELWLDTTGSDYTLKTWDGSAWREIVVTSTMIKDGTIVNADVNASAAIAGTKISPDFGSQNVLTTGTATAASLNPTGSSVPTNGVYLPATNSVAISTNGTGRLTVGTTAVSSTLAVDHPLGAVGTPSITFTGDLNTGFWSPAADTIAASTGGSERARIDSSGNIVISGGGNITANFDNVTVANRSYFQTTTANEFTVVGAIPNGTNTTTAFYAFNNSIPTNASYCGSVINNTTSIIRSSATGTGTLLPLTFETNNQEQARFTTTDRYFRMASGTGGIQFGGDTAAANALDDYEEGTFTPIIAFGGGTTGITYSTQSGRYVKIGKCVTIVIALLLTNKGSSTGTATLTGLPFTSASVGTYSCYPQNLAFADMLVFHNINATTTINLREITNAGAATELTNADFANNTLLYLTGHYEV
jgi:hypothetical protein